MVPGGQGVGIQGTRGSGIGLQGPRGSRGRLTGSLGVKGEADRVPGGSTGSFDGSSDYLEGIYAHI